MTSPLLRGAGFTPPSRSAQTLLRGIALPQLVTLFALTLSIVTVLAVVSWSVAADKRMPVPVTSNSQSFLL